MLFHCNLTRTADIADHDRCKGMGSVLAHCEKVQQAVQQPKTKQNSSLKKKKKNEGCRDSNHCKPSAVGVAIC